MDYDKFLDLYSITIEECMTLYENNELCALIENGHIINFSKKNNKTNE